jgi:hypothetical protein
MTFNKRIIPSFTKLFDKSISAIDFNQNSIIALLKGPDTQYKNILMKENEQLSVPIINDQCRDKNSFLQIHVRKLQSQCLGFIIQNSHCINK